MKKEQNKKAIVLASGGLDSTTVMAIAQNDGFEIYALSFDYGQRHRVELAAAKTITQALGAKQHLIVNTDLGQIGGSALTEDITVPKDRDFTDDSEEIPITYVPARNTIFLAYALAWSEVLDTPHIFIGVNAIDYSGYLDCRPEFIQAFEHMANLTTKAGVEGLYRLQIHTPLSQMSKADIIKKGVQLGIDYGLTHSCYDPDENGNACGHCDSCLLRKKGFADAGVADPTRYV